MNEGQRLIMEYQEALKVMAHARQPSEVFTAAQKVADTYGPRLVTYEIKCLICPRTFTHTTTVQHASQYRDAPRGVCGHHGEAEAAVVS